MATASNACTIISTLCARAFFSGTLIPPFSSDEHTSSVNRYEQIIQTGNILYRQLHLPPGQPNLEVREVIAKIKDLDMVLTEDIGYFHVEELIAKINNLLESNRKQAGVLIVPAARSYAVLVQRRLDSILGESGRMPRPIRLRHFPHARMKLLASKIYIGLINIDFFHIVMQIVLEISRDTTFTTVNLPIGILKGKRHFPVYFDLSLRRYTVGM